MPVPRPAREQKSPSNQRFRSRAARRGRLCLGIKLAQNRPVQRELAGHRRSARRRAVRGGAWLVLKSTIKTSFGVTTSRSICPETSAGGRPGRSSRPTIATSARLPSANTGANRGSAISASTFSASAARSASSQPTALRARKFCAASRRRSAARSGSDCSRRCTSVPRCSALVRCSTDSPDRSFGAAPPASEGRRK